MQQTSPVNKFIIADFKDPMNFSIKDTLYGKKLDLKIYKTEKCHKGDLFCPISFNGQIEQCQ